MCEQNILGSVLVSSFEVDIWPSVQRYGLWIERLWVRFRWISRVVGQSAVIRSNSDSALANNSRYSSQSNLWPLNRQTIMLHDRRNIHFCCTISQIAGSDVLSFAIKHFFPLFFYNHDLWTLRRQREKIIRVLKLASPTKFFAFEKSFRASIDACRKKHWLIEA